MTLNQDEDAVDATADASPSRDSIVRCEQPRSPPELPEIWVESPKEHVTTGVRTASKRTKLKKCNKCHAKKPLDEYGFYRNNYGCGYRACCKICEKKTRSETHETNKPAIGPMENERECSICKSVKSIEEFIRDNRKKTGYAASCKHCHRLSQRGAVAERCGVTDARLCKGCGIVKPPVEFNKLALVAGPDGLCRSCNKAPTRAEPRVTQPTVSEKLCGWCGLIKSSADFTRDSRKPSGLGTRCKACEMERGRLKRQQQQQQQQSFWRLDGGLPLGPHGVVAPTAGPLWLHPAAVSGAPAADQDQAGGIVGDSAGILPASAAAALRNPIPMLSRPHVRPSSHASGPLPMSPHLLHPIGAHALPRPRAKLEPRPAALEVVTLGAGPGGWGSPFEPLARLNPQAGLNAAVVSGGGGWGDLSPSSSGIAASDPSLWGIAALAAAPRGHHGVSAMEPLGASERIQSDGGFEAAGPHKAVSGVEVGDLAGKPCKICSRCGILKSSDHFRQKKAGLGPYCKVCSNELRDEMRVAEGLPPRRPAPASRRASVRCSFLSMMTQDTSPAPAAGGNTSRPRGRPKRAVRGAPPLPGPEALSHMIDMDATLAWGSPRGPVYNENPFLYPHSLDQQQQQGQFMGVPAAGTRGGKGGVDHEVKRQRHWCPAPLQPVHFSCERIDPGQQQQQQGGGGGGSPRLAEQGLSTGGGSAGSGLLGLDFDDSDLFLGSGDLPSPHSMADLSGPFLSRSLACDGRSPEMAAAVFSRPSPPPVTSAWPPPRTTTTTTTAGDGSQALNRHQPDELSTGGTTDSDPAPRRPLTRKRTRRLETSTPTAPTVKGGRVVAPRGAAAAEPGEVNGGGDGGRFGVVIEPAANIGGGGGSGTEGRVKLRLRLHRTADVPSRKADGAALEPSPQPATRHPLGPFGAEGGRERTGGGHHDAGFLAAFGGSDARSKPGSGNDAALAAVRNPFHGGPFTPPVPSAPAGSLGAAPVPHTAPSPSPPPCWMPSSSSYGGLMSESNDEFAEFARLYLRAYEEGGGEGAGPSSSSPGALKRTESGSPTLASLLAMQQQQTHLQSKGSGSGALSPGPSPGFDFLLDPN